VENNSRELREIVEGCIQKKRKFQEKLFKLYYGKMLTVCMRYMKDYDVAQEVLQEGFIKVFDKLESFDYNGSFEGWIRRIVVNTAIDAIRKSKNNPFLVEDEVNTFLDDNPAPFELEDNLKEIGIQAEIALKAIQSLSPAYQTVFNLYVFENYTHKEISEILSISEGTSKSNFAKAKANLKKVLEKELIK
jgi:RNA polymerase sigma-70 factor, ECF subfamily